MRHLEDRGRGPYRFDRVILTSPVTSRVGLSRVTGQLVAAPLLWEVAPIRSATRSLRTAAPGRGEHRAGPGRSLPVARSRAPRTAGGGTSRASARRPDVPARSAAEAAAGVPGHHRRSVRRRGCACGPGLPTAVAGQAGSAVKSNVTSPPVDSFDGVNSAGVTSMPSSACSEMEPVRCDLLHPAIFPW